MTPTAAMAWWFSTCAGVVFSAATGVFLLLVPGHGPAASILRLLHDCLSSISHDEIPDLDPVAGIATAIAVCVVVARLGLATVRRWRRNQRLHQGHLDVLRLTGSDNSGIVPTLWLRQDDPVAYSLGGRRAMIVASHGLAERLSVQELKAVFAHEQAHLRGRHHLLISLADTLGKALRVVPLMRKLPGAIRVLAELAADRAAARQCGCETVRSALASVTSPSAPPSALAMAGGDVAVRLSELSLQPGKPPLGARLRAVAGGLGATLAPLIVASGMLLATNVLGCR
ncbi:M56 family metallopeptidase [Amycolatopsis sp. H20-H5]|uniref:M56 family metallopeptidase n=1 Tax=Amycolatopsis sp. H20-H5 TaxID=3046309 RepID=UPI002DB613D1|nr:M56 family metallopeptidase [Amycolatopsis sp. H20-H5]MEC3974391.1 M56 family metallopeptidase [Amycolatopsis sp. H20-H5]